MAHGMTVRCAVTRHDQAGSLGHAFIGVFRRGNKPPVEPGEEKSFSMRLSEGTQILESKRLNEKEI